MGHTWIFQHDSDPKHKPKSTCHWLQQNKVKVLEWSSQSPDLNIIEPLWEDLKCAIHTRQPKNLQELEAFCQGEWVALPSEKIKSFIHNYHKRLQAVIDVKGARHGIKSWGVRQALWLTKSKAVSGLPPQLLSLAESPANKIPNQEIRVQNAIKHACFWDTTEEQPVKYSNTLLFNLLHLCATLQSSHPLIGRRMLTEKYILAASWKRGKNLFQVRGQNGLKYNSMDPLPRISGKQQVSETAHNPLETFYPVSPTVDLQKVHVYKEQVNCTGFRGQHFYPHAHTLYFLEGEDARCKLRPEQFRAKMIMFLFGNALAQAHTLFGAKTYQVLDHPITIQAVGTNGRLFQFIVFQLNTTDLSGDDGIKNQSVTRPLVDPLQFAYRANRSVDDSVNMGLHFILEHLDGAGTYARILFVDDCTSTHPAVKLLKTATWS
ncbi:39S ribosomal protein L37, mitochondrial isoform X3 [Phyllopteryx taeniolatus]|uniref:39S ribosomal protein L37, mitochondrial isoform X3 n=1 Tax=Phyllopteryx taeniolatus TaxID=161469 RepID=UPI002AD5358F|nr:39S ribosomal protein L37, mitochondrial isoform X3 [Phyllopteryx taeniolatus]